ncbi:MAG: hypothetical protein RSP_18140 [Rhodanobacter sp.]
MTISRHPLTIEEVTQVTHELWALAQGSFDDLPRGLIPVFEMKSKADAKRPGIGFSLDFLNTLPEDKLFPFVMLEVVRIATFYRTEGKPTQAALDETFEGLVNAVSEYNEWVEEQLADEASLATKH